MEGFKFTYKVVIKGKAKSKRDIALFENMIKDVLSCMAASITDIWGKSHHAKVHIEKVETKEK